MQKDFSTVDIAIRKARLIAQLEGIKGVQANGDEVSHACHSAPYDAALLC